MQRIRDVSDPDQWFYVTSENNPADRASRGSTVKDLVDASNPSWFHGPEFLWKDNIVEKKFKKQELSAKDPEVKRSAIVCLLARKSVFDSDALNVTKFSSWSKLRRVIALCLRFVNILRKRIKPRKDSVTQLQPLTASELDSVSISHTEERSKADFSRRVCIEEVASNKNSEREDILDFRHWILSLMTGVS